jgi:hypothetical protein
MSLQSWNETLVAQQGAGTLKTTYTTAATVLNPQCLYTLPPNWWYPGRTMRVTMAGGLSNIATTPGTVVFQVMMGTIAVWSSGNIQLNATAHTTLPFWLQVYLTCQVVGSTTTAKLMGMGILSGIQPTLTAAQVDAVNTPGLFPVPATAPAQGTGFDSTVANILDFWVGFSISNIGNGIQPAIYTVEAMN